MPHLPDLLKWNSAHFCSIKSYFYWCCKCWHYNLSKLVHKDANISPFINFFRSEKFWLFCKISQFVNGANNELSQFSASGLCCLKIRRYSGELQSKIRVSMTAYTWCLCLISSKDKGGLCLPRGPCGFMTVHTNLLLMH